MDKLIDKPKPQKDPSIAIENKEGKKKLFLHIRYGRDNLSEGSGYLSDVKGIPDIKNDNERNEIIEVEVSPALFEKHMNESNNYSRYARNYEGRDADIMDVLLQVKNLHGTPGIGLIKDLLQDDSTSRAIKIQDMIDKNSLSS